MPEKKLKNKKKFKEKIDFKYNLSVYWSFLRKYKWIFVFLIFLTLIASATYVVDKFLFKVIIDKGTEFSSGLISRSELVSILITLLIIYLVALAVRTILRFVNLHLLIRLTGKMVVDLKRKFFNHVISLSHGFHTTHKTGSLISRIIRGGHAIDSMNDLIIFEFTPLITSLIVVVGSLIYFDLASVAILFLIVVVFIGFSIIVQNKSKPYGQISNKTEDIEKANISDFLTNIDSIKYFGKEDLIKSRFKKLSENTKNTAIKFWNFFRWLEAGQGLILGLGIFFLIYFPILKFLDGQLTLGSLVFIYTIYGNVVAPLFGFVQGIREYYRAMIDFDALFQYNKIENEIKDKHDAKELQIKDGEVEFKNVNFNYGKRKIFKNFSLKIPKDKKIALVGHSGSGKTTLVKLLYRLHDVDSGKILIDGKDIREFKQESLRSEMSMVPQECVLFDDTVYNNVAFSNPKATREEVTKAMKFAQLDRVVKDFPKKEKTIVGERGVKLSGGEKQRVSIARAILANKKILVLDEATSSLDSKTEYEIQESLKELMKGRTSIIIAHRLSTIMHADKIVVLKKGQIVQMGTHEQLIRQAGEYKSLWELQKGGYIK